MASVEYVKGQPHEPEYYSLLLLATLGMMLVAMANDLIVLFLGLELAGLSTYALAGFSKFTKKSTEAAMKYFIVGAFSSAILIFGISLIYGVTGTTSIGELGSQLVHSGFDSIVIVALIMMIAGLGFKVAAVPFHMWAPDVYQGAPTTITAFLAAGSKKMGFAAMFKIFLVATIAFKADLSITLGILAVATMTVGNLAALRQTDLKRMLAYSSIAQAGYILMALAIGSQYALAGGIFHIMTHAFMKSGAFIVIAITTITLVGSRIDDYRGLRVRTPITALCMAIFLLSLAGIPPFGGFASKFVLFSSAVDAGGWLVWLAIAAVLNSALSLYYYARVLKRMYVLPEIVGNKVKVPRSMLIPMVLAAVAVVIMGLFPEQFVDVALSAARTLIP
jgi:NADH-quinone oxidoreductase subunit N